MFLESDMSQISDESGSKNSHTSQASYLSLSLTPVQEKLIDCATTVHRENLVRSLLRPSWIYKPLFIIENYPFSISICNTNVDDCPMIYVNQAMTKMTGYSRDKLVGRNFSMLYGPKTEEKKASLIAKAMRGKYAEKAIVTHYTKSGYPYINLLACKPAFTTMGNQYSIAIHCTTKTTISQLDNVENILSLLTYTTL